MKKFIVIMAIFSLIIPPIFSDGENKVLTRDISVQIINITVTQA